MPNLLIKSHDESLFVRSTKKLMSGRQCHYLFNENLLTKIVSCNSEMDQLEKKLHDAYDITTDAFKQHFVPYNKQEEQRKIMTINGK